MGKTAQLLYVFSNIKIKGSCRGVFHISLLKGHLMSQSLNPKPSPKCKIWLKGLAVN